MGERNRKRILILGGGFAGIYAAQHLERALGDAEDFEIALVNRTNYFVFQPMLPEVISGSIGLVDVVSPIRRLLPRTTLHVRDVEAIDLERRSVSLSPGFQPHAHAIEYDHLVLALGTVTDFRGMRGLPEHALPFKDLGDALRLRDHVIRALEEAAVERHDPELRRSLLTFVVAGGGFSGVEVAAELNDFVRGVARHYRGLDPSEIRVVLVHSQERILPEVSERLARVAARKLRERGVELRLKTRLQAATAEEVFLAGGERIAARTLVSTVPSSPHPLLGDLGVEKAKNGKLVVDPHLRVRGRANVWALGDCAMVPLRDGAGFSPPTAQHAVRQAKTLATNVMAAIRGGEPRSFDFADLGKMGSLGHHSAVAEILGVGISGFLAWWLWRTIYLLKLPGWSRRLKVATSWTLDLVLPPELVQLRLGAAAGLQQEHYEPGELVFREGDLGDRIYVIENGKAEVVRRDGERERSLAMLGAGEVFGETALLRRTARNASIRCIEPMNVVSIPRREFAMLRAFFPEVDAALERLTAKRAS